MGFLTLAVTTGNITHYHSCEDEGHNADYLHHIGFSWETAIEIASWAYCSPDGAEYEQDEMPGVYIRIV